MSGSTARFRKTAPPGHPGILEFEAAGLAVLREAGARVPRVYQADADSIVMEQVQGAGRPGPDQERQFGRELAALHRHTADRFGACVPGLTAYLGLQQIDLTPTEQWAESYLDRRLRPLIAQAVDAGLLPSAANDLASRLGPAHLGPDEPPALIHGDLWAGNRLVDSGGASWLIDPSAQYGHRECDLAMMRLFGGFAEEVVEAYQQEYPLAHGWQERTALYQAVPLVVHVLLFGTGYADQTMTVLSRAQQAGRD